MTTPASLPLSPSTSEPSQSPPNLKQPGGTQPAVYSANQQHLVDLDARFNRRTIPLMPRRAFERLVESILQQKTSQGDMGDIEVEVERRVQQEIDRLEGAAEGSKLDVFLTPPDALPDGLSRLLESVRETTFQGHTEFVVGAVSLIRRQYHDMSASASMLSGQASSSKPTTLKSTPPSRSRRKTSRNSKSTSPQLRRSGRIAKLTKFNRQPI